SGVQPVCFDNQKVVRAVLRDETDVQFVESFIEDFWSHEVSVGAVDFRIGSGDLPRLTRHGIEYRELIDDVQALIDRERETHAATAGGGWFDDFKDLNQIYAQLDSLVLANPTLASTFLVGTSIENRAIRGIAISTGGAGKPAIVFNSCQHAREWISPMVTMYIADQLLSQYNIDPELTSLVNNVDFYIIPVVNPDGYVHTWGPNRLWRKNRRNNLDGNFGVDLNRNWGFAWGGPGSSGNTFSDTYRGIAPFSEPESAALRDFILGLSNVRAHIDYHSFSQVILTPWGYEFEHLAPTLDAAEFDVLSQSMADAVLAAGLPYKPGPIGGILYRAAGGAVDWMYGERGICSCTVELRDTGEFGFILPADQIIPTCVENMEGMKEFAFWAATASSLRLYHNQSTLPVVASPDQSNTITVQARAWPGEQLDQGSVSVWHRTDVEGAFTETSLSPGAPTVFQSYSGDLPTTPCGQTVEYYFSAATTSMETATLPESAPTEVFSMPVAIVSTMVSDTFETSSGWSIMSVGDTATRGRWERAVPVGNSFSSQGNYAITFVQPDVDHTPDPGDECFMTQNGPYQQQNPTYVNGITTLTSPAFNITGDGEAYVSFWAFFNNSNGAGDRFEVSLSSNNGTNWVSLVDITSPTYVTTETVYWRRYLFRVSDYITPSTQTKLRFVARNAAPVTNLVEAAVDDVEFFRVYCPPIPGDLDSDGFVDVSDHEILLDCLMGPSTAHPVDCDDANFDPDIDVDMADYIIFSYLLPGT
ncbi:MAG: M14 family zinc carboxypeptidase, partial [Planctomycetaceae bacterium]